MEVISHTLPEEKLQEIFGSVGWKQLPDEVYKRVRVQPAVYTVEEHTVSKSDCQADETDALSVRVMIEGWAPGKQQELPS